MKLIYSFFLLLLLQISSHAQTKVEKSFFIDNKQLYTYKNIYENRDSFSPLGDRKNAFGFLSGTVWIHLKFTNQTQNEQSNIIELPYPLLDYIEVLEYENKKPIDHYTTGDLSNFNSRKVNSRTFVIPYKLQAQSSKEFMLGIRSKGPLNINMKFLSQEEYYQSSKESTMVIGIYYGGVLIMLIFNLILFFIIKQRVYLYYVIFHFFYVFVQLSMNGLAFEYLYPNNPELNSYFFLSLMILANLSAILFSCVFLDTKKKHPKLYTYFHLLMYVFATLFVLNFILDYKFMAITATIVSSISISSLFLGAIYTLLKDGSASSKFFVAAWSFLLLGSLLTEFAFMGIIPLNFITLYANQFGAIIELSILSIALAYRYNILFIQVKKTEAQLRVLNEELEKKVKERTQTINDKNIDLSREIKNKNILNKELFHRVKNNLQMISGILHMQSKKLEDNLSKEVLQHSVQTISAMGMIHEKLYKSHNLEAVDFEEYLFELTKYIHNLLNVKQVHFEIKCKNVMLTLQNAVPLGIIVNEIITNSFKHAYSKKDPRDLKISITMSKDDRNNTVLKISDNGIGTKISTLKKNFGFKLIESLSSYQLNAKLECYSKNGFAYVISFKDI